MELKKLFGLALFFYFLIVFFVFSDNISLNESFENLSFSNLTLNFTQSDINNSLNFSRNWSFQPIEKRFEKEGKFISKRDNLRNYYSMIKTVKNNYSNRVSKNFTIEIYVPENVTLNSSLFDLEINETLFAKIYFNDSVPIESIEFNELMIENNSINLGVESLNIVNTNFSQAYAIDPEQLNFTNATVTVRAKGKNLYKCENWFFENQTCLGNLTLFMTNLTPGVEYTFILTPKDPAFFESIPDEDNDARAINGVLELVSDVSFGNDGGDIHDAYFRFSNISVPPNSIINNAYLNLTSTSNQSGTVLRSNIFGLRESNCVNFNTLSAGDDPTDNTRTNNFTAWDNLNSWVDLENSNNTVSPDISNVIQEIVDLSGWSINNSICLVIEDDGSDSNAIRESTRFSEVVASLFVDFTVITAGNLTVEALDPTPFSDNFFLQNSTRELDFNVSCAGGTFCPEYNLTLFYNDTIKLGETGSVFLSNFSSKLVEFELNYDNVPVVIAIPVTDNNADDNSLIPVFNSINTTHMNISLCQDAAATTCDLTVLEEEVNYFVFDPIVSNQFDWIEVGTVSGTTNGGNTPVSFNKTFATAPFIFASVQGDADGGSSIAPTIWAHSITTTGAQLIGCEHQGNGNTCTGGNVELFGYVAIDVNNDDLKKFNFGSEAISASTFTAISFGEIYTSPRIMVLANSDSGNQDPKYPMARLVTDSGAEIRYCEQDGAGDCDSHNAEATVWFVLEDGFIETNTESNVSVLTITNSDPFYVLNNSISVPVSVDSSSIVTFEINFTGLIGLKKRLFARLDNGNTSSNFDITIVGETNVVWNTSFFNFTEAFVDEPIQSVNLSIVSTNSNANVDINCQSGNCSIIQDNFGDPISLGNTEEFQVQFSCVSNSTGNFFAIYNVTSDEFPEGNLLNLTCDMGIKLLDIDLVSPSPGITEQVIQNQTLQVDFNVSCADASPCGNLNVTLVYQSRTIIGESGTVSSANFSSSLIKFRNSYSETPIVIATSKSDNANDDNALIPLINSINTTHLNISICKDAGSTTCETIVDFEEVNYFVFDRNISNSYDWIEVGSVSGTTGGGNTPVSFNKIFENNPFLFTTVQTDSDSPLDIAPTTWSHTISTTGAQIIGCEHPGTGDSCTGGNSETIGYVAIDVLNNNLFGFDFGTESISNSLYTPISFVQNFTDPNIMVSQNSDSGGQDPQYPQARSVTISGAEVRYCEQDGAGVCDGHNAEEIMWFAIEEGFIFVDEIGFSPVLTDSSEVPFFTNSSNPNSINLGANSSQIVSFLLNATGFIDTQFNIFAILNNGDTSESFVLEIIGKPTVSWNSNSVFIDDVFTNDFPVSESESIIALYDNTNLNISCILGDCLTITSNFSTLFDLDDDEITNIQFTCDNSVDGNYSALFSVVSSEDLIFDIINVSCSVETKLYDLDLVDPLPFSILNVIQNQTINVSINASCISVSDCGVFNLSIGYRNISPVGEVGSVSIANFETKDILFNNNYTTTPIIIATPVSDNANDNNALIPVISSVDEEGFSISLCKDSGNTDCESSVVSEIVNYLVLDPNLINDYPWVEIGYITANSNGGNNLITFNKTFNNPPIVFSSTQTNNDGGSFMAPTSWTHSITTTTAQFIACDHPFSAGANENNCAGNTTETYAYFAIDISNVSFSNIDFGSESIASSTYTPISFTQSFTNPGLIVAQNSDTGAEDPQYPQARSLNTLGADIRFCEQDGPGDCDTHSAETIVWLALEEGSIFVNDSIFGLVPFSMGSPIFSNNSELIEVNLSANFSINVDYKLNFTGFQGTSFELFGILNDGSKSEIFNVNILKLNELYQAYFGNINRNLLLALDFSNVFYDFGISKDTNVYVYDVDSEINWSSLRAIGTNISFGQSNNDFEEIDILLGNSLYRQDISDRFSSDGSIPFNLKNITIYGENILNVPFVNSTNTSSFITGILWDYSDDVSGNFEYDINDSEDLIFITIVNNSQQGSFGIYDYEISVPETLGDYIGNVSNIEFRTE